MRIPYADMPGVTFEPGDPGPDEIERRGIYVDDDHVGDIVYVQRRRRKVSGEGTTEYGWLPDVEPKLRRLRTQHEAAQYLVDRRTVHAMLGRIK